MISAGSWPVVARALPFDEPEPAPEPGPVDPSPPPPGFGAASAVTATEMPPGVPAASRALTTRSCAPTGTVGTVKARRAVPSASAVAVPSSTGSECSSNVAVVRGSLLDVALMRPSART